MSYEETDNAASGSTEASADGLANALGTGGGEDVYLGEEAKKDGKPSPAIIGALLLAVAGGGYFMFFKKPPASADAADAGVASVQEADETISQFLDKGTANIRVMEDMLTKTQKIVEQFRSYPSVSQIPPSELGTNPFRFDHAAGDLDGELVKKKREAERQAALTAVQALALQSVMHSGNHKACMINNTMYKEGDKVEAFTVERIAPNSVVVRDGVYRFELKMQ